MRKAYFACILFLTFVVLCYGAIEKNTPSKSPEKISTPSIETDTIPKKNKKNKIADDIKRLMPTWACFILTFRFCPPDSQLDYRN